ncbi:ABC transporter substrate-binding protein [Aurantiacibacter zhengii]|uniref:Iron ABC transporter substrate-binding protein n=1 Tax=Aurantiacibacter zhengii TaxID=2307003 RepID=A0A418NX37_9SPHN|nr:ABC transporter substrate-binding protein [Aurantiacibacter zhengii]RIV89170.1 iron ABC transporter substrate-binding protein [Aurantiacibacter zhengii]
MTVSGCGSANPHSETDRPSIVSLNPCADAILAEIAAQGQLLAISHYSHDPQASSMLPEQAAQFASTGGTAEEVLALAPDVVVADIFIQPSTRRALEQAGIDVVTIGISSTLEDSLAQIDLLGEATGNSVEAKRLSDEIAASWESLAWQGEPVTALLWQQGGIVGGEGSLANALLEHSGFASLSAARGLGQGAYLPLENVLADPPQVVITAGDEIAFNHPAMTRSVAHYDLPSSLLYCGGPTIPRALARLTEIRRQVP